MQFVSPPAWTTVAFVLLILAVQALLLYAVFRTAREREVGIRRVIGTAIGFALVMAASAVAAESGFMAGGGNPPRAALYAVAANLVAVALAASGWGRAMAAAVVPAYWVLFQGFRLPLEVILHLWNAAGTIPEQMTWHGQNPDIVSGVLGLVLGGYFLRNPRARWAAALAHGVGLLLLFNVARVALLSAPTPLRAFDGQPLLLPFHAPFTWIIPFAVAAALFAHIVGFRALRTSGT